MEYEINSDSQINSFTNLTTRFVILGNKNVLIHN